jgi:hypothetical protein
MRTGCVCKYVSSCIGRMFISYVLHSVVLVIMPLVYCNHACIIGLLEFYVSSSILKDTTFRKLDLFPPSIEGGETNILERPLERANLNHWT